MGCFIFFLRSWLFCRVTTGYIRMGSKTSGTADGNKNADNDKNCNRDVNTDKYSAADRHIHWNENTNADVFKNGNSHNKLNIQCSKFNVYNN